ncbi:MAG: GtrA family protein [Thermoproteota archaeon]
MTRFPAVFLKEEDHLTSPDKIQAIVFQASSPRGDLENTLNRAVYEDASYSEPYLSIIIPVCRSAEVLSGFISKIKDSVGENFEIIIVRGCGQTCDPERMQEILDKYGRKLKILDGHGVKGSIAVGEALRIARAQRIVIVNIDHQFPSEALQKIVEKLEEEYDLVAASIHYHAGGLAGFLEKVTSKIGVFITHVLLPKTRSVTNPLSTCFAFKKPMINGVEIRPLSIGVLPEILVKGNYRKVCETSFKIEGSTGRRMFYLCEGLRYFRHIYSLVMEVKEYKRILSFITVGLFGVLVNEFLLWFLTEYMKLYYMVSAVLSAEAAILSNFTFNELFTFRDLVKDRSAKSLLKRAFDYNWTRAFGTCLQLLTLFLLTTVLNIHYLIANLIGITVNLIWGYSTSITLVWRR